MNMYDKFHLVLVRPVRIYGEIRTKGYIALRRTRVTHRYVRSFERRAYNPGTLPGFGINHAEVNYTIFKKNGVINGFNIKPGFIGAVYKGRLVAVATGFMCGGLTAVFTLQHNKKGGWTWEHDWVDEYDDDPVVAKLADAAFKAEAYFNAYAS